ncbi:putative lipoprotein [Burkholderia thailandensis MSMB121]|uniref:hypothetical protein n=1 Tax=Burkholderia humptydooensis TaxID=430531 RepID=UPI000328061E|nr:hypothetical protein [Burkholderia humptydooensis]AGK50983.1 putative lipoprotein [Burkholderia thailandensis MSMB121]ATF33645.1 hypothetical protein CO709_10275 [Burkholderia thailandensis]KST71725.1 hypothetical protein WS76_24625 [Burkholderia humptydooensis]
MTIRKISTKLASAAAVALVAACSQNGPNGGGSPRAGNAGGTITDGVNQPPTAVTPTDGARYGNPGSSGAPPMAPGGGNSATPAPGSNY